MARRQDGFFPALVLAALAGLGLAPIVTMAGEWIDSTQAAALYVTFVATVFVGLSGATRSQKLAAALLVLGVGITSSAFASGMMTTAVVLTAALGVSRARILYRGRLARPWLVELCVGVAALAAAELVVSPSYFGIALSVWAYWLVQSAYFLVPVVAGDDDERHRADPFDVAMKRATDLMDG